MARKSSGTGQGGKSLQDRQLAADVRTLTLTEIKSILQNRKHKLYGPILTRLAGSVLPRLNEHTGEDGGAIKVEGIQVSFRTNEPASGGK